MAKTNGNDSQFDSPAHRIWGDDLGASEPSVSRDRMMLPIAEATALHTVSTLVGVTALARRESRGCHRRDDFPEQSSRWRLPVTLRLDGDTLHVRTPIHEYAA